MPFLTGENKARPHETLYWRFGNQWAVRHGDMKLVQAKDGGPKPLLIDLAADIGESRDLTAEQPERAAELLALYQRWDAEQAAPTGGQEKAGRRGKRRMRAE